MNEIRRRTSAIASVTVASDDVSQSCHPVNVTEADDELLSDIDKEIMKTIPQNSTVQASIEVDRYLKKDLIPRKNRSIEMVVRPQKYIPKFVPTYRTFGRTRA